MSRRPKLIPGNLYYIKMKNVWSHKQAPSTSRTYYDGKTMATHEYIAEVIKLEPVDQNKLCVLLSILASTQEVDSAELKMASSKYLQADGTYQRPLTIQYMGEFNEGGKYLWERAAYIQLKGSSPSWMSDAIIQYYNPKNLPLYLNWPFGIDWILKQLKEMPNETRQGLLRPNAPVKRRSPQA